MTCLLQVMEHCRGGDLFKQLMMKGGTLDEAWVCTEVCQPCITIFVSHWASRQCIRLQSLAIDVQLVHLTRMGKQQQGINISWLISLIACHQGTPGYLQIIAPLLSILARMHKETIVHRYTCMPFRCATLCHVMS